jgi:pimeloyl-ACP methyl ester carboxylesterase
MLNNGEIFAAPKKKYEETIFFVHFYGGNKKALQRHIKWVNSLGYDAFAFNLEGRSWLLDIPVTSGLHLGWKHYYADQIEALLNEIPGQKIMYAFSNPSAAAIEALARRHCADIRALVCDSGPSGHFVTSVANLIKQEKKYPWIPTLALAAVSSFFWDPPFENNIHRDLENLPQNFPILSIRGWKDPLIPPDHIDAVFDPHPGLEWRKLALPEAGHLNGLRDFPQEYQPPVEKFLNSFSTALNDKKASRRSSVGNTLT